LHDDTFLDAVLPVLRADFQLVETWNHEASASLRMPVTVIGGESDPLVDREMLLGWRLYTSGEFDLIEMEGDHFFPFNRQQEFLAALSRVLSAALKFGPMN
jgi:medium-chain acyl-[acyl-carrier-protein] hydrolase